MRATILALFLASPAFGAIEIDPELQGQLRLDRAGNLIFFDSSNPFVSFSDLAVDLISGQGEHQGVVEFDLRHRSTIEEPIYFRFYLAGRSGDAEVYAYTSSADGILDESDFGAHDNHLATLDITSSNPPRFELFYVPYNLDVTEQYNNAIGGWLGFNFSTELGSYLAPLNETVVVHGGKATLPLDGALTLGTELLGPVQFPIPEPSAFSIWLATVAAVAIGYSCSRLHYARRAA